MWQTFLHKWLNVPYQLAYTKYQYPKHPAATVVFLHGIGSSGRMWDKLAHHMPGNVRLISLDLLGFGRSPKPNWKTYNTKTQADSIATTLFSLRVTGPIVIVGHSLGSLVAIELAKRYKTLIKSVVLISPPLYKPDDNPKKFQYKPDEFLQQLYKTMSEHPNDTERILRMAGAYSLFNKGFDSKSMNAAAYMATLEAAIINQTSLKDVQKIKRPIHVITGRLDLFVLERNVKELAKKMPNVTWKSVMGGHEIIGLMYPAVKKEIHAAIKQAERRKQTA